MANGLLMGMEDPLTMGLLQAAAALATPQHQGGGFGPAMMAFPQAMQQASAARRQRESDELQRELFGFTKEKTGLELKTLRDNLERQQRIRDQLAALNGGGQQPAAPGGLTPAGNVPIPQGMAFRDVGRADMAATAPAAAASVSPRMAQSQRLMAMADVYERNGDFEQASKIREAATKLLPELNRIETVMRGGKPTQRQYFKDGTYQDITDADPAVSLTYQNGVGYHPLTGKPIAAAGDVNQPFMPQIGPDGRVTGVPNSQVQNFLLTKADRGATRISMGQDFQQELDKEMGKGLVDRHKLYTFAPELVTNLQRAKDLVPKAGAFVGSFGDKKLAVVEFMNRNLGLDISVDEVTSANELRSRVFRQVMENLKKMDAQPSEYQQRIMMESLGQINTDPNALVRFLDATIEGVRQKVNIHNQQVQSAEKSGMKFRYPLTIDLEGVPKIGGDAEYNALPSGAEFIGPDGQRRRKP
jgi:hypothetical protein